MSSTPKISIGMPVLNGGDEVRFALESVLQQDFADWQLTVSNNCSEDQTADVVREFASQDSRIRLRNQTHRLTAIENFATLTTDVISPYFVFLAADDQWKPDFLSATYGALESNPDAVLATGQVRLGDRLALGTCPLVDAGRRKRIGRYLINPSDNSRYYGLQRSEVVKELFERLPTGYFFALDWLQMVRSLKVGKHLEIPRVLLERSESPLDRYYQDQDQSAIFNRLPMARFSLAMLREFPLASLSSVWQLLLLNYRIANLKKLIT